MNTTPPKPPEGFRLITDAERKGPPHPAALYSYAGCSKWMTRIAPGVSYQKTKENFYAVPIEEKSAWKLPDPPEGRQWHKPEEITQAMAEEGWRPLLVSEQTEKGDKAKVSGIWQECDAGYEVGGIMLPRGTKRPLPVEVKEASSLRIVPAKYIKAAETVVTYTSFYYTPDGATPAGYGNPFAGIRYKMPCGHEVSLSDAEFAALKDIPCPCGNPNHWTFKYLPPKTQQPTEQNTMALYSDIPNTSGVSTPTELPPVGSKWAVVYETSTGKRETLIGTIKAAGPQGILLSTKSGNPLYTVDAWNSRAKTRIFSRKELRQQSRTVSLPASAPVTSYKKPVSTIAAIWKLAKVTQFTIGAAWTAKAVTPWAVAAFYYLSSLVQK